MPIINLFSKRMKVERGEVSDVYQYTNFDNNLKVKIIHIINDFFEKIHLSEEYYHEIINILCKEYGVFELTGRYRNNYGHLFNYFLEEENTEKALNVVELCFQSIDKFAKKDNSVGYIMNSKISPDNAIRELNDRFKEEGFGYKYESGIIIKLSNEIIHNEIIKPVLKLLSDKSFKGSEDEFLSAHAHYRKGENKECITDCLKAFESTMKIICKKNKYLIKDNASAKELIAKLFEEKYIPQYLQCNFTSLQSLIESGVPTIRNKLSAHGQGDKNINPDDNITEYVIHLTASNILFLIKLN
jgi:hypothetical protein